MPKGMSGKLLFTVETMVMVVQFVQMKNERKEDDLICVIFCTMLLYH
jgi:hypothetical protein